jgi:hypothetical protein
MTIPHADHAVVDIRKLHDYCLNPLHDEGKHKARVFAAALGMTGADAERLRDILLQASQPMMPTWDTEMHTGNATW